VIFGIWLDGYLWDRAFRKREAEEEASRKEIV
jgi:hypothetical protein